MPNEPPAGLEIQAWEIRPSPYTKTHSLLASSVGYKRIDFSMNLMAFSKSFSSAELLAMRIHFSHSLLLASIWIAVVAVAVVVVVVVVVVDVCAVIAGGWLNSKLDVQLAGCEHPTSFENLGFSLTLFRSILPLSKTRNEYSVCMLISSIEIELLNANATK